MPGQGDHNRPQPAAANPFEEKTPRINEYTATEITILQNRLDRQLGPEYISTRPGAGGTRVHYIAAEKVINLANDVFGFNGWSSQIQRVDMDFVDEGREGRISLGLSIVVRVTLKDGTFHEDIGYGHTENVKGKAAAFEKAKKEAATDAMKRALRNFGNVLGNCLYDKDYLNRVTKIKVAPSRWDEENLQRHPDFAPLKKDNIQDRSSNAANQPKTITPPIAPTPSRANGQGIVESAVPAQLPQNDTVMSNGTDLDDEFGAEIFDDVEVSEARPDEVVLKPRFSVQPQQTAQIQPPQQSRPISNAPVAQQQQTAASTPPNQTNPQHQTPAPNGVPNIGFTFSRHADLLTSASSPPSNPNILRTIAPFDTHHTTHSGAEAANDPDNRTPHALSTRARTSLVDHSVSRPVKRQKVGQEVPELPKDAAPASVTRRRDFVNPAAEIGRRVGMPGSPAPGVGRVGGVGSGGSPYRPPMRGGASYTSVQAQAQAQAQAQTQARTPLGDVSNVSGQGGGTHTDVSTIEAEKRKHSEVSSVRGQDGAENASAA